MLMIVHDIAEQQQMVAGRVPGVLLNHGGTAFCCTPVLVVGADYHSDKGRKGRARTVVG